jgi:hypothetical protein
MSSGAKTLPPNRHGEKLPKTTNPTKAAENSHFESLQFALIGTIQDYADIPPRRQEPIVTRSGEMKLHQPLGIAAISRTGHSVVVMPEIHLREG